MNEGSRKKDYEEFYAPVYQQVYASQPCIDAALDIFRSMKPMLDYCQEKCKEDEACLELCGEQGLIGIQEEIMKVNDDITE